MTQNSAFKKRVRERMRVTGEKYTEARRKLLAEDDARFEKDLARDSHPGDRNIGEGS